MPRDYENFEFGQIGWFQTFTGKRFDLPIPSQDQICIRDIAHSLSLISRYNGHCRWFFSVAQHSCLVHDIAAEKVESENLPQNPLNLPLQGLLHDAAEAYFSDIPTPIKRMFPKLQKYEDNILKVVFRKFFGYDTYCATIDEIDKRMLATEKRVLMEEEVDDWGCGNYKPYKKIYSHLVSWSPEKAEQEFLTRFYAIVPIQQD